jgi:hypothetical protein
MAEESCLHIKEITTVRSSLRVLMATLAFLAQTIQAILISVILVSSHDY